MFKTKKSRTLLMNVIFGSMFYGSIIVFSAIVLGTFQGIAMGVLTMVTSYIILKFVEWVQDGTEEISIIVGQEDDGEI